MEDHQALLRQAHEMEEKKEAESLKLKEKLSYRKELDDIAHELEQSLEDEDEESAPESDHDEADDAVQQSNNKEAKRKTRAQRNKEKRVRLEQIMNKKKQHEKEIRKQIDHLNQIEEEVKQHQEKLKAMAEKRQETREYIEKEGVKRLGKHYVKERAIDVQLQDELSESLRQLKVKYSWARIYHHNPHLTGWLFFQ